MKKVIIEIEVRSNMTNEEIIEFYKNHFKYSSVVEPKVKVEDICSK